MQAESVLTVARGLTSLDELKKHLQTLEITLPRTGTMNLMLGSGSSRAKPACRMNR